MAAQIADFDEFPEDAPWLQQNREPHAAYSAFCQFRDLGVRRSLRQACQNYYELDELPDRRGRHAGKLSQINDWSRAWDWVERAWAYTAHLDRLARIEAVESARLMARRHAAVATVAIAKAGEALNNVKSDQLSVRDAIALLDLGVKVERAARGTVDPEADDTSILEEADRTMRQVLATNPEVALAARQVALALAQAPDAAIPATATIQPDDAPPPKHPQPEGDPVRIKPGELST